MRPTTALRLLAGLDTLPDEPALRPETLRSARILADDLDRVCSEMECVESGDRARLRRQCREIERIAADLAAVGVDVRGAAL